MKTTIFLSTILFALVAGLCWDAGMKGFCLGCVFVVTILVSALQLDYLDGGKTFSSVDEKYKSQNG